MILVTVDFGRDIVKPVTALISTSKKDVSQNASQATVSILKWVD